MNIVLIIILLTLHFVCCQQGVDDYKKRYGLYNMHTSPNYSTADNAPGYSVKENSVKQTANGLEIPLTLTENISFFGHAIQDLIVQVDYETNERIHVKIYDREQRQVQVPDSPLGLLRPPSQNRGSGRRKGPTENYEFKYTNSPRFGFQISRRSDNAVLFDTMGLALIFENEYLEISSHIPDTSIYGIGHGNYTYPFYIDIRNNGTSSGTFLLNAFAVNVVTTKDRITYKAIGGVLDFYFFVPNDTRPNSVVQSYTTLVGRPMIPSLWMLGYQSCRSTYQNIDLIEATVAQHKQHNIPLEVQWIMNDPASLCGGSCSSIGESKSSNADNAIAQLKENSLIAISAVETVAESLRYIISNGAGNMSENVIATQVISFGNTSHHDLYDLCGSMSYNTEKVTQDLNATTRPLLVSKSAHAGSGQYMGFWTGDISSTWDALQTSVADVFQAQMYGISYSGANICGFAGNATEELCTRWQSLGAFYPFARNYNGEGSADQEPYVWITTAQATRLALAVRYTLLPYMYTLFEEAHRLGTPVWRPLIFEYPEFAVDLANNHQQFLVGTDILVSPVLAKGGITINAQFPPGLWYDWYSFALLNSTNATNTVKLDAPLTHIPVHVRGGSILVTKTPKLLVAETYATAFNLIIALDEKQQAYGRLYIDDGHTVEPPLKSNINFIFINNTLVVNGQFDYQNTENIGNITILHDGQDTVPYSEAILVMNNSTDKAFNATSTTNPLVKVVADTSISLAQPFSIKFQ